jgi:hypothetical protein
MKCKADYVAYVSGNTPERDCSGEAEPSGEEALNANNILSILGSANIWPVEAAIGSSKYLLTMRHKYNYIPHGQNQIFRPKVSSPPREGQPQSSSRKSCRSLVRDLEFFRCPRPGSSQIRDGAQSAGGPSAGQQQCNGLRLFSPFVLSGADSARERWPGCSGSAKAGAATQAQAGSRSDGLSSETEVGKSLVEAVGPGRPYSGALRPQSSCPQRRAGARAPGKKTSEIILDRPVDGAAAAYEELRRHILAGSPGGSHSGMIELLREGVAGWIESRAACRGVAVQSATRPVAPPLLCDGLHREIVHVLADIALTYREEVKP